ncbi:BadF/BadG/BcrA/BcrD ATPase family protein [Alteromonas sp. S015]|uniref:BadF/BadG/BcrA/BcrD ATPase family protein n=1 Tax=Alteromonas sp. S015 TaxID=3117401 RepID=UPI002FE31063
MTQNYFAGIDGGGTKCKARLENAQGELLGEGLSGPCNPAQSAETAFASIIEATTLALEAASLPAIKMSDLNVCMGLAGVNVARYRETAQRWIFPFKRTHITTDLHIACLGAHAGQDGAIIITGTGSSALASVGENLASIGGHGFPLGDKAGGAWLGLRALQYTLEALDSLVPPTRLVADICEALGTDEPQVIVGKSLHYKSSDFGKFAPIVVKCANGSDPVALSIVNEGKQYLTGVISQLEELGAKRISMIGGLSSQWAEWLPDNIQQRLQPAKCSPEFGAISLIKDLVKEC